MKPAKSKTDSNTGLNRVFNRVANGTDSDSNPSRFFNAVKVGDIEEITSILQKHPDAVTWRDEKNGGRTALIYAAEEGQLGAVTALTLAGADVEDKNDKGSTALMFASQAGHEAIVRQLLARNANPNTANNEGATPLMVAAWEGRNSICELLVNAGADIDACDNDMCTALMFAALNGHTSVCLTLMDMGADKNKTQNTGEKLTAADMAESAGYQTLAQIIRAFVPSERKKNQAQQKKTAEAPDVIFAAMLCEDFEAVLRLLKKDNGQINAANERGSTLLMFAAMKGKADIIEALISLGADPNAKNKQGTTALMVAASENNAAACEALLDHGANRDDKDNEGMTAADFAEQNGYGDLATLLKKQAAPKQKAPEEEEKDLPEMLQELQKAKEEALTRINEPKPPAPPSREIKSLLEKIRKGKLSD